MLNANIFMGLRNCWCGNWAGRRKLQFEIPMGCVGFLKFSERLLCLNFKGKKHPLVHPLQANLWQLINCWAWLSPYFRVWHCSGILQSLCLPVTFPNIKLQRRTLCCRYNMCFPKLLLFTDFLAGFFFLALLFTVTFLDLLPVFTNISSALPGLLNTGRLNPLRESHTTSPSPRELRWLTFLLHSLPFHQRKGIRCINFTR